MSINLQQFENFKNPYSEDSFYLFYNKNRLYIEHVKKNNTIDTIEFTNKINEDILISDKHYLSESYKILLSISKNINNNIRLNLDGSIDNHEKYDKYKISDGCEIKIGNRCYPKIKFFNKKNNESEVYVISKKGNKLIIFELNSDETKATKEIKYIFEIKKQKTNEK